MGGRECVHFFPDPNLGTDGRITLNWILNERGCEGVHWIQLAQDRIQWWVLVKMGMNLQVP
jgi:hypothetical protein